MVVEETMTIVPASDATKDAAIAIDEARKKGEAARLKLVAGKDLAPSADETKH
jgi:hypothetical protein